MSQNMYKYITSGVCASEINFDLRDGKVYLISFEDGCDGNLKALGILLDGMEATELIDRLQGIRCGYRKTSCAAQLAAAVEEVLAQETREPQDPDEQES